MSADVKNAKTIFFAGVAIGITISFIVIVILFGII